MLDQQEPGTYLATFGKLRVTPLDLAAGSLPKGSANPAAWTMSPIPAIPEPRVIDDGETVTIDLFVDPATGAKLIEDIRINPPASTVARVPRPVPTVSGVARNFAVTDRYQKLALAVSIGFRGAGPLGRLQFIDETRGLARPDDELYSLWSAEISSGRQLAVA